MDIGFFGCVSNPAIGVTAYTADVTWHHVFQITMVPFITILVHLYSNKLERII